MCEWSTLKPHTIQVHRQILVQEALSTTKLIEHPWPRSRALLYLARLLPDDLLPQALELARALDPPDNRAITLAYLARHFSDQQKVELLDEIHQAILQIPDPAARLWALTTVASQQTYQAALLTWREILDCLPFELDLHQRARWLAGLPEVLLTEAIELIHAIPDPAARADALVQLAGCLPGENSASLFSEALEIVRSLSDPVERAYWGSALAISFPESERPSLVQSAFQAALVASDPLATVAIISYLAALLPASQLTQSLELAGQLPDPLQRANCLALLAPHLPETQQHAVIAEAFTLVQSIPDDWSRAESLELLCPFLPANDHPTALEIGRHIQDPWARSDVLGGLYECLEADMKALAFNEALISARSIESPWGRARALTSLAAHMAA